MNKIIEFNGVPGTGKTTIAKALLELEKEILVYEKLKKKYMHRNKFKTIYYLFAYGDIKILWLLFLLILKSKPIELETFYRIRNIYSIVVMYSIINKKYNNKVIVMDEGIIQALVLTIYNKNYINYKRYNKLVETILNKYNNLHLVNCKLELNEIIKRYKNRNRSKDKHILSKSQKELYLITKRRKESNEYIWNLLKKFNFNKNINLDANSDIQNNAKLIYKQFVI